MSTRNFYPDVFPGTRIDFSNSTMLPNSLEFGRATTGTYTDQNGIIRTAIPGEPRFAYDPETGESLGLLVEEGRTNFFNDSSILSNIVTFNGTAGTASVLLPMTGTVETVRTLSTNIFSNNAYGSIDVPTSGTYYFSYAWQNTSSLTYFPPNMFDTTGTLVSGAFSVSWTGGALSAQSIENILVSLDTNGQSGITLGINGGTNAAKSTWSVAAVNAYDSLVLKGWTISFNP